MTAPDNVFLVSLERDSFAMLKTIRSPWIDVTITDPPYSEHCQSNQVSGVVPTKVDLPFAPLESVSFARDLVRATKRWVLSFCAIEHLGLIREVVGQRTPNGGAYVRGGVWYKPNSMGQLTRDRPAAAYEAIAIMHRHDGEKMRWNGRGSYGIWACNGTRGEPERHPNQKPLKLCLELVAKFSEPGELVFDPFCGSGRIGEACMLLGRRYIGFDFSAEWVAKARTRIEAAAERWGELEGKIESCKMPSAIEES